MAAKKTKRRGVRPFNPFVASSTWDVLVERRGRAWRWSLLIFSDQRLDPAISFRIDGSAAAYSSAASARRAARAWLRERGLI